MQGHAAGGRKQRVPWRWADCDDYGIRHLPTHLAGAGRQEQLKDLLLGYSWIKAKLARTDVDAVIADYDLAGDDDELWLVQRALQESSHFLARDRRHLPGQLYGRLMSFDTEETPAIAGMLGGIIGAEREPWLRPVTRSLRPAGEAPPRTLEGHTGYVRAVSVFDNGAKAISASDDATMRVWSIEERAVIVAFAADAPCHRVRGISRRTDNRRGRSCGNGLCTAAGGTRAPWALEQEIRGTGEGGAVEKACDACCVR